MFKQSIANMLGEYGVDPTGLPGDVVPVEYFHTLTEIGSTNWTRMVVSIQLLRPRKEWVHPKGELAVLVLNGIGRQMRKGRMRGSLRFTASGVEYHGWWRSVTLD